MSKIDQVEIEETLYNLKDKYTWSGTKAEWEALDKSTLPQDEVITVIITDDQVESSLDILVTKEELTANINSGKVADSLLVKQLTMDLDGCSLERQSDGVYLTYVPPGGADSVRKKLGEPEIKVVSQTANYPTAAPNSEQTVTFSVEFDAIEGYRLAYAGITQMNTYNSNGTIKYVEFTNMQITENTVSWSVHTKRGTGGGTSSVVIQGVFIQV